MGRSFVAAEVKKLVTVAKYRLPFLFKQRFECRYILQNDRHEHIAGTHDRKDLGEVLRQADIAELVHQEVNGDGQTAAVFVVGQIE